jgi:hypothetical protein
MDILSVILKKLKMINLKSALKYLRHRAAIKLQAYLTLLGDWLYDKDITKRRVRSIISLIYAIIRPLALLVLIVVGALLLWSLRDPLTMLVRFLVQSIQGLGEYLGVPNPSEFTTIIIATVIIGIGTFVFGRLSRHHESFPRPMLELQYGTTYVNAKGVESYTVLVSNALGTTSAVDCQAYLKVSDINPRDVLDVASAEYTPRDVSSDSPIDINLLWEGKEEEVTIRSGLGAEIEVWRYVPAKKGVPAHFEVPTDSKDFKSTICLNLKHFYPKLMIVPLNGECITAEFQTIQDYQSRKWGIFIRHG